MLAAAAASIYFSPDYASYAVGETFSVSIYVSSEKQAINAASGAISFPTDKLEALSVSKNGSIFTFWIQEPSFSNKSGAINFEGIVLNPGFQGKSGKIAAVSFRAKAAGAARLNFSSGAVLANDGQGTNILSKLKAAEFSLGYVRFSAAQSTTPSAASGAPNAPVIRSRTHPDPNRWYAASDAEFSWDLPSDAEAARLLVGKIPQAVPTVFYSPAVSSKKISGLTDGIWYFHVRLKNKFGWGDISHFRFQIDSEKPSSFEISELERKDPTDPKAKFSFKAEDGLSGIDHYEVRIDEGAPQIWRGGENGVYETPGLGPGKHILIAKAVDKAGNYLANSVEFTIEPLNPPIFTEYPSKLKSGEAAALEGKTYPEARVVVWTKKGKEEPKSQIVKSAPSGKFAFIPGKLKDGVYEIWAETIDKRGARSGPSEKISLIVEQPEILKIGSMTVTALTVAVPLVALIALLLGIIWYGWHKFSSFRKRVRKETKEAEQSLSKAFKLLKKDIEEQIKLLEKAGARRRLTEEEKRIAKRLKKNLDSARKLVGKEIKDIKKLK